MAKPKIIIIGGGASGLMAAIVAKRQGAKVTLLERKSKIGRKILATGNGRCNISNANVSVSNYHSQKDCESLYRYVYEQFDLDALKAFFHGLGVDVIENEKGKLYPMSLQASSVVDALLMELERLKVEIVTDAEVIDVEIDHQYKVITSEKTYYGTHVILATGGRSCPDLGSNGSGYTLAQIAGHKITTIFPSLVQIKTDAPYLKSIKGTKVEGVVSVFENDVLIQEASGEILFTDYGISGPPVLDISRVVSERFIHHKQSMIKLDLFPDIQDLDEYLVERLNHVYSKTTQDFLVGMVHKRLIVPLLKEAGIDIHKKACDMTREERNALVGVLKSLTMEVTGTNQWNQSQVTAGGVDIEELDPETLMSKLSKNLYITGELMDIDGDCGGYNLQWAFSSGYVAGYHASGGM